MEPRSLAGKIGSNGSYSWIGSAVLAGIVLSGLLLTFNTVISAEDAQEGIDQRNAAEIEQENRAFCGRLDMEPGADAYGSCARELEHIRQAHAERLRRHRF